MSYSAGHEVSSIKPGPQEERSKRELKFKYNMAAYESFAKQGFESPEYYNRPDKWEFEFISKVDPGKGPVKTRVTRMFRIRAIDYDSEKHETKEYLYYETEWYALQWNGNPLRLNEHVVGRHKEQTKRLELGDFDPKTGIQRSWYVKDTPKTVYTIPFSKKAVDEALENKHPFGPDSINTTDKDSVIYYGKFDRILGMESFRCGDYTYEQFIVPEWKEFLGLAIQEGGPQRRVRYPDEEMKRMGLYS